MAPLPPHDEIVALRAYADQHGPGPCDNCLVQTARYERFGDGSIRPLCVKCSKDEFTQKREDPDGN